MRSQLIIMILLFPNICMKVSSVKIKKILARSIVPDRAVGAAVVQSTPNLRPTSMAL